MKRRIILAATGLLILSGCGNVAQNMQKTEDTPKTEKQATITTGRVSHNVYQALMENGQYATSTGKELSAGSMNNNNYNQSNYEKGLLNIAQAQFATNDYYFMEGQKIKRKDLEKWLGRKSDENTDGLNDSNTENPILLQKVIEYDFMNTSNQELGGMCVALILNKIDYSGTQPREFSQEELESAAQKMGNEILQRLRKDKDIANVPITLALFQQASKDDIAGGNYIYQATSDKNDAELKWEKINEEHILLPNVSGERNTATEDGLANKFNEFKNTVQSFFQSLSGVTATAYYNNQALQSLSITIESKYATQTEVTSLAQYIGKTAESQFTFDAPLEIQLESINKVQGFLYREIGETKIHSHIFE